MTTNNYMHINTKHADYNNSIIGDSDDFNQETVFVSEYYTGGPVWLNILNSGQEAHAVLNRDECKQMIKALKKAVKDMNRKTEEAA